MELKAPKLTKNVSTRKDRLEAVQRYLKAKNAAFKQLSKKEQRVQIAKDVIEQLDAKKMIANSTYLSPQTERALYANDEDLGDMGVAEVTCQVKCEVCGIGSLFVAAVENGPKIKVKNLIDDDDDLYGSDWDNRASQVEYLKEWFPSDMLDTIETYFEVGSGNHHSASPIRRHWDPDARLHMIMENIISNDGKFDPRNGCHKWTDVPCHSDIGDIDDE